MATIQISLDDIATDFAVFEKDQVLTSDQLNSVANFFDDQTRLTRVKLLGVGIVCGLRVSLVGSTIVVTKGAGVTTDGDILYFNSDTVFDQYKVYDQTNPEYSFFYAKETMIPVYELVAQGVKDARATSLANFATQTKKALSDMVAVLFMESYIKSSDLCSGTDCDNLGQDYVTTIKLLLVDKASAGLFQNKLNTPDQAAVALNEITADRAVISNAITDSNQLANVYRNAGFAIHTKLISELPKLYPKCSALLTEIFPTNPSATWVSRLNAFKATYGKVNFGIQYYYDFLKDVVETYNQFIELLFNERTWCCPSVDAFPKHLLLGDVVPPAANADENRTPFYPSPATSRTVEQLKHARFLALKLDTLLRTFHPPDGGGAIRITPSLFEDQSLEERAIPYYYKVGGANSIQQCWNFRLHQQGMDAWNYSYNAAAYGAKGGAANPFGSQLGRFCFFRIEGHIGAQVGSVTDNLKGQIHVQNLPICVRSVFLGNAISGVVKGPGIRYTPLHDLSYLLRQDAYYQVSNVMKFSDDFKNQINAAVSNNIITNTSPCCNSATVQDIASQSNDFISNGVTEIQNKINRTYSQYQTDTSWKTDLGNIMQTAGEFKANLGKVVNTQFSTPFDTLISSSHLNWLDWIDQMISASNDRYDAKSLFVNYVTQHPGLEHFAGVLRGGTFVLVYDSSNTVVADFMLPYCCCDNTESEPAQPLLPKPDWKPDWLVTNGLKVLPSLDTFVDDFVTSKLTDFKNTILPNIEDKITAAGQYLNVFKDSVGLMTNLFGQGRTNINVGTGFADGFLAAAMSGMQSLQQQIILLAQRASDSNLPQDVRDGFNNLAQHAQNGLGQIMQNTVRYISNSGMDVSNGSEGFNALMSISSALPNLTDSNAVSNLQSGLNSVRMATVNNGLKVLIGNLVDIKTPVFTPVTPVVTPITPVVTPVTPVVTPVTPVVTPVTPVVTPVTPVVTPITPVVTPITPVVDPIKPVVTPITPVVDPIKPVVTPVTPVVEPIKPVVTPVTPVVEPIKPVVTPITPVVEPIKPVVTPITPVVDPIKPVVTPVKPVNFGVKPKVKPVAKPALKPTVKPPAKRKKKN